MRATRAAPLRTSERSARDVRGDRVGAPAAQRGPRLLRQEDRRGQDPQGSAPPSSAGSATPSTASSRPTPGGSPHQPAKRAREGNRGTTLAPARPAHTPHTGSSDKPLPSPHQAYALGSRTPAPSPLPARANTSERAHLTTERISVGAQEKVVRKLRATHRTGGSEPMSSLHGHR